MPPGPAPLTKSNFDDAGPFLFNKEDPRALLTIADHVMRSCISFIVTNYITFANLLRNRSFRASGNSSFA